MHAAPQTDSGLYVTVRKTPERADAVPGVVHVIDNRTIAAAAIASPTQISGLVPGFSFNDPFGRFNPAPSFRGLIQPGLGDDPSVGFFNDGLYMSGRSSLNALAFDLQTIEVAKGPQNALYGRNSFGGALNARSARPTGQQEVWFDGRAGTHDRQDIQAGVNLPLNDMVRARLALYHKDWGGPDSNSLPGGPEIGREKTQGARLSFNVSPHAERDIMLRLTHVRDEDSQPKGFLVPANCGPRVTDGAPRLYCGEIPDSADSYAANNVAGGRHQGYERRHTRLGLEWTEHFSARTHMAVLLGGAMEESLFIRDDDYSAVNAARAGVDTERFDTQFDARLHHRTDDGFWHGFAGVSGYRYFNKVDRLDQYFILGETEPSGPRVKNSTETLGVYGSLTRQLAHGFAVTGDARWQWEGKDFQSSTVALTTGEPLDLAQSWTAFTPKLTVSWTEQSSGLLLYGSVARGYKTGGFNDRANLFDDERTYDPEENITYEAGVKNIPVAERLRLNLGAFWIDWRDQQVTAYSTAAATQNFFINNAGETTVKGLEAAVRWQPSRDWTFDVGYSYADARYDRYFDPDLANVAGFSPDGDVSGKRLPRYAPHQGHVTASYRTPSPFPQWDFVAGGQFTYESSQYTDNSNTSETGVRTLLNLQGGLESPGLALGVWVDNALNEKDPAVGIPWTNAAAGFRREWLVVPEDGTTIGVRLKVKW